MGSSKTAAQKRRDYAIENAIAPKIHYTPEEIPTLAQVQDFVAENAFRVDPVEFWNHYSGSSPPWHGRDGCRLWSWRYSVAIWSTRNGSRPR